jgi:hypothetical protein
VTNEEKKQAALNVLTLRASAVPPNLGLPPNMPAEHKESVLRFREVLRGITAALYCDCFSDDQLQALLDFYGSEMGKAILHAESEVASRLQGQRREVARQFEEEVAKRPNSPLATHSFGDAVESAVKGLEENGDVTLTATREHVVDYLCKQLAFYKIGPFTQQGK